ncbi:tonB-system energizer ExbB [Marinomonas spartinae]|nr:tonB-system energizer ExbB [Marinomonas spartinae]
MTVQAGDLSTDVGTDSAAVVLPSSNTVNSSPDGESKVSTEAPVTVNNASNASDSSPATSSTPVLTPTTDSVNLPVANQSTSTVQDFSAVALYDHADRIVKTVILILIFASMMSWSIWLGKTCELLSRRRRLQKSLAAVGNKRSLHDCSDFAIENCERMKEMALAELNHINGCLSFHSIEAIKERVQARFQRLEASESRRASRGASVLATTSAVAPFVGLFGTVWGIMHSFISIAQTQTTNLSVVAPGIAEALFATALGLVVAIPAVILYNILGRMITGYRIIVSDVTTHTLCLLSHDLEALQDKQHNNPLTSVA